MIDDRNEDSFIVADADDGLPLTYCRTVDDFTRWAHAYAASWQYTVTIRDTPMLYAEFQLAGAPILTVYGVRQYFYE